MTTSTNLIDYLGKGTLASRTVTPSLNPSTQGLYWATDVGQLSLWDGSAWHENILAGGGSSSGTLNGVVSGGQAVWESGLTFRVPASTYYINGVLYSSIEQTVTLTAADATLDRIDVIYLDTSGLVGKVTGTAAAAPSEPDVNPASQLKIKFVLVNATATSPSGTSTEDVYKENTEWTTSTSGATWATASTNNPYAGTKDIEATSLAAAAYVQLQRSSSETLDSVSTLNLFIRSKASWASGRGLRLQFYLNGVAKGAAVTLSQGFFNFDSSVTSAYQFVSVPIPNFILPAGTLVNQLRITDFGGSIGFYIDNITLTTNGATVGGGTGSGITQADADARYFRIANALSEGVAATIRSNVAAAGSGAVTGSGLTMATARLLGRTTASTGAIEQITVGSGLTLAGGSLSAAATRWDFNPPLASAFTAFSGDGNSATLADDTDLGLKITTSVATASAISRGGYIALPAGDFIAISKFLVMGDTVSSIAGSMMMYESATSKAMHMQTFCAAADNYQFREQLITGGGAATTNFSSYHMRKNEIWIRISRSGTTISLDWSYTGKEWVNAWSEVQTIYFTTAPNRIGLSLWMGHASKLPTLYCSYWSQNW